LPFSVNWTGLAAGMTAFAGILAAYAAVIRARRETRREDEEECERKLLQARGDAMEASDALYEIRRGRMKE
jgi:hypothetical protein